MIKVKDIVYSIEDYINDILINKLHKQYILHDKHIFKIRYVVTRLEDVMVDDELHQAKIKQYTRVTDVLTNKEHVIYTAVLSEEECNNLNVPYIVRTSSLPLTFKL